MGAAASLLLAYGFYRLCERPFTARETRCMLRLPEWRLGNLLTDGLAAMVESERFRFLQARSVDTNLACRRCDLCYICGGSCRAWRDPASPCDVDGRHPIVPSESDTA